MEETSLQKIWQKQERTRSSKNNSLLKKQLKFFEKEDSNLVPDPRKINYKFNRFHFAELTRYEQITISLSRLRLPREIFDLFST